MCSTKKLQRLKVSGRMGCDNLTRDIMSHSQDDFLSVNSSSNIYLQSIGNKIGTADLTIRRIN